MGDTLTTPITHTHVTHSMKPSADPPVIYIYTHLLTCADSAWSAGPRHSEQISGRQGDRVHGSREVLEWWWEEAGGILLGIKGVVLYIILVLNIKVLSLFACNVAFKPGWM